MAVIVQMVEGSALNKFEITQQGLGIGRSIQNDVYLDDPSVSQKHARIVRKALKDGAYVCFIQDLNSTNHTYVNNKKIKKAVPLNDQDLIVIGTKNFKFVDEDNEKLAQTRAFKKSWFPGMYYLDK